MSKTADIINKQQKKNQKLFKQKEVFDPRIIDDNSNRQLWTTESVELAINGLRECYKLKDNPFLKTVRGAQLRKANLPYKYTEDELKCIEYASQDICWFGNNFTKLKDGARGWTNIKLREYQENTLKQYDRERWNILMFPRQSGKTTTTVIKIVHFATFNFDKDIVVIAQSDKVVSEILNKIKECFESLPFFMQPGFVSFNKKGFVLDNGCRLSIGVASESVVQGFSLDLLFIDEFAYIRPSIVDKFWNNLYPSLTNNPESRVIIASTPNGRNLFWKLWTGAINKTNRFVPYRIYWYDVPGRDQQFKFDTIANVGLDGWLMGFECSFDVGLKSIFTSKIQQELRQKQSDYEKSWHFNNYYIGNKYQIYFLNREKYNYDLKNDYFLFTIDLGEGLEQDSTVLKIKKIDWSIKNQRLEYKTIGIFHRNDIAVEDFADMIVDLMQYFDKNKCRIVVENNTYGGEFFNEIDNILRYESQNYPWFSNELFAKFNRESKKDFERGIRWNAYNKKTAVKSFSNLVANGIMEETYSLSIEEYLNFGRQANGTFSANYGHDDLVMADVTGAYFIKNGNIFSKQFLTNVESSLRLIYNDEALEIRKQKEELTRKIAGRYEHNGFHLRNHKECLEKVEKQTEDVMMFMVE